MLFYDIAITFGDEVERIWKQRFTGATVLWFLVSSIVSRIRFVLILADPAASLAIRVQNRYLSPLGYIVIIVCASLVAV